MPTEARTLADAMVGADVVMGLSAKGAFTAEMIASMADQPIIFAMANPDPEITPEEARAIRADAIVATGRSDYPNQVNNVLGFPYIFRGALDVRASTINDAMKIAAAYAIAALAREEVPDEVTAAYRGRRLRYGAGIPDPDPVRPAPDQRRAGGRGQGRHGDRRRAPAARQPRALPPGAEEPPRPHRQPDAADHRARPGPAQAGRVRRRRGGEEHQRRDRLAQSAGWARRS